MTTNTMTGMRWWGWGADGHDRPLPVAAQQLIREEFGVPEGRSIPADFPAVRLPDSRLSPAARAALGRVVGVEHVDDRFQTRLTRAAGRSYPDLLALRSGILERAPDAVLMPGSAVEVAALLAECATLGVAVVPFGGGTSVVGGVDPVSAQFDAVVSVDMRRLNQVLEVDHRSQLATVEAGILGPELEAELGRRGLTLGHFPQSFEFSTLGGWVATRSAGQASTGYGRIDELVVSLKMSTPSGEVDARTVPASAAGPDLRELMIGSEGTLGIITEVTVRVRPVPEAKRYEAWSLKSFEAGAEALRELEQSGAAPDIARLSDMEETRLSLTLSGGGAAVAALQRYLRMRGHAGGCLMVLGYEDSPARVAERRRHTAAVLSDWGALKLGTAPGRKWEAGRFHGPYVRDELMSRGVLVDTLETATTWTNLQPLHAAVRGALTGALGERGTPARVMCHISHLYPTGASLYFTFLARAERGRELEQWRAAKRAAGDAIMANGGTITHHHAVGLDHAAWLEPEIGALGVDLLRAAKRRLDPAGIMNPGKLADGYPASTG